MSQKNKLMSVGQAAKKAGISRQSLQYYLMMGVVEATEVSHSGRRLFDETAVTDIRLVRKLNESGYPLRAIRELFVEGRSKSKGGNQ
ncbi:MAG TPA: MerR family transcriptional regulator [Sedimentisphaerales bacterium]|nr:MerR family transcriptional regulator [Sedimentisphaerales bacterium]